MSDQLFERAVHDWLEAGSDRTPPTAIDAVLLAVKTTPQEREVRVPRRFSLMPSTMRLAAGVAIVAVLGLVALMFLNRDLDFGGRPTPTPTIVPTAAPTSYGLPYPTPTQFTMRLPDGWVRYTSAQYGTILGHPRDWGVDPADRAWDLETDAADWLSPAMDDFTSPAGDVRVSVWSVPVGTFHDESPWGIDLEAFIDAYCQKTGSASCATVLNGAVRLCREVRDCHPGLLVGVAPPFDREVQAFFSGPDNNELISVVTLWRGQTDPEVAPYGGGRKLVEDFLSTMCVTPEEGHSGGPFPCG